MNKILTLIALIFLLVILTSLSAEAAPITQSYCYPSEPGLIVRVQAEIWEDGLKKAARTCFKALTRGVYPGSERGLDIIDICANPRPCK